MADELTTSRLSLRVLTVGDADDLHAIFSDPETHTIGDGPVTHRSGTHDWLERREARRREGGVAWYGVRDASGELIGNAGVFTGRTGPHPELGFEIRHADQPRGFGAEAAAAVVAEAHRAGFAEVWATVREWNGASLRALERIGFQWRRVEHDARGALVYLWHSHS